MIGSRTSNFRPWKLIFSRRIQQKTIMQVIQTWNEIWDCAKKKSWVGFFLQVKLKKLLLGWGFLFENITKLWLNINRIFVLYHYEILSIYIILDIFTKQLSMFILILNPEQLENFKLTLANIMQNINVWSNVLTDLRNLLCFPSPFIDSVSILFATNQTGWIEQIVQTIEWDNIAASSGTTDQ